jgi:DeoR/GlpR family transcriptional regulator of sugar metabolism
MLQIERIQKVLDYINVCNKTNVAELCREFNVSPVTIRRDLDYLANDGLIIKTHGGVLSTQNKLSYEVPYYKKSNYNLDQKELIGAAAAKLINDNDVVIIDAGTTTLQVAKHIKSKNVTVITNDLQIATQLASMPSLEVIVVGGRLEKGVYTLTGSNAVELIEKFHANKVFLGADALDIDFGISNRTLAEVDVKLAMTKAADEVIVVTDSSKFNIKSFYSLLPLSEIDTLVTDHVDQNLKDYLELNGKKMILVGAKAKKSS